MARGGDPDIKRREAEVRLQKVQSLLAAAFTQAEIVPRIVAEFDISETQAKRDIKKVRERALPGSKERAEMREVIGHGYLAAYRTALGKQGRCKNCGHAVPKPAVGVAVQTLTSMVHLWKLQSSPEEMLNDDEYRAATLEALVREMPRFTPAELARIIEAAKGAMAARG